MLAPRTVDGLEELSSDGDALCELSDPFFLGLLSDVVAVMAVDPASRRGVAVEVRSAIFGITSPASVISGLWTSQ